MKKMFNAVISAVIITAQIFASVPALAADEVQTIEKTVLDLNDAITKGTVKRDGKMIRVNDENSAQWDLSDIRATGCIKFRMKSDIVEQKPTLSLTCHKKGGAYYDNKKKISLKDYKGEDNDGFSEIKVPLSEFSDKASYWKDPQTDYEFDFTNVVRLVFSIDATYTNIRDISFVDMVYPAEPQLDSSYMDFATGSYSVDITFSENMESEAWNPENYTIDGVKAETVDYIDELKLYRIIFDIMPDFPGEKILTIADCVKDANGLVINPRTLTVTNSPLQDIVAVTNTSNKGVIDSGKLKCSNTARCIYAPDGNQNVTMFTAVYDGEHLIAYGFSDTKELAWKDTYDFTTEIDLPDDAPSELRVETYFVDTPVNGKPLAAKFEYTL